ncbi:hypothetical protein BDZ85DRAFT_208313 [Elsinoe ampelina]|uniref:Zn(2)-C6 fungal-type domain-containing protein n=1 Tax=Elsinoe ampelina TaxID=302913 RepID=A0A6A6FY73_9PEZI|nr:hypothetical protein BDZ85DRAFT_208313 [Elsinoe ampelina]
MAVRGGGPSRRSHTKSRKGCKTCKRRHIRCDESFPQCRNCTKHHVRCDYMDATTPDTDSITNASSEQASPTPTPTDESVASHQLRRPDSVYSDLSLSFSMDPEAQFGSDPQLITNLYAIADNLESKGASDLTVWASTIRRHLAVAPGYPYVLDALKGFSASQLAWITQSPQAREQSLQYSTSALSGLHQAVGQFNKDNADSVLATAVLLISQSRDWLSWSSLLGGLSSITASIENWAEESRYSDIVKIINFSFAMKKMQQEPNHLPDMERIELFRKVAMSLQQLRGSLNGRPIEAHWVDQFLDLTTRLQSSEPARTAEAEFNQLYVLRKWTFWLPVLLFQDGPVDMLKLAVVAHLYAMVLALKPAYPHILADLCGTASFEPLTNVLNRMEAMKSQMGFFDLADATAMMQFPQAELAKYNDSAPWAQTRQQVTLMVPDISMYFSEEINAPGNLSPAFTPAAFEPMHTRASSTASAYLAVPVSMGYTGETGFSQNISQWGTFPSPGFPTQDFFGDDDLLFTDDEQIKTLADPFGGYVQPCEIWT